MLLLLLLFVGCGWLLLLPSRRHCLIQVLPTYPVTREQYPQILPASRGFAETLFGDMAKQLRSCRPTFVWNHHSFWPCVLNQTTMTTTTTTTCCHQCHICHYYHYFCRCCSYCRHCCLSSAFIVVIVFIIIVIVIFVIPRCTSLLGSWHKRQSLLRWNVVRDGLATNVTLFSVACCKDEP